MNSKKISKALSNTNDNCVDEAIANTEKRESNIWLKVGAIAACFVVLVVAVTLILPLLLKGNESSTDSNTSKYKKYTWTEDAEVIVWEWDELTTREKYTSAEIKGIKYYAWGRRPVSEGFIDEKIGSYALWGYDEITDEKHAETFDIYKIHNVAPEQFIAAKMEDAYCLFKKEGYDPPETLGELFEQIDLEHVIEFSRFSENDGEPYVLSKDDFIWEVLSECTEALFVQDDNFLAIERERISFTITSESIGVYKHVLEITEDGYLSTNIFSYRYLFNIGEEAAKRIIDYAKKNALKTEQEPFEKAIVGEVIETTEKYVLVDDSPLCINPDDGIIYKISLNDKRISRYIDKNYIGIGDYVRVVYDEEIDENYVIAYPTSISNLHLYFEKEEGTSESDYSSTEATTVTHNMVDLE